MSAVHATEEAAPPRPGCARPVGCAVRLPLQVVTVRPVWRLGARRQARVPTPCPAAIPEPHHRLSLYCEAPGCTRVDLHARCGLVFHVAATPAQGPEARAGLRPADRAHSLSTASPAPPHAPRGQPVHPSSTRRGGVVVAVVTGANQSMGGSSLGGRPRACVAVSMQAARDPHRDLTLETDAAYVSWPSPSGPGSVCPSDASLPSTSHTRTARPSDVDFGSRRRGAVAFSREASRPPWP